jgi:acetyl-CoA C-acetyltransferase
VSAVTPPPSRLAGLRPAFAKDGTITAGNASQISDGACAVVVMSKAKAEELGLEWLAEIGAHGQVAGPDSTLQLQPANAIKACDKEGIAVSDVDLFELNEAFAAVGIESARALGVSEDVVNVNGGAIALGHPSACRVRASCCTWPSSSSAAVAAPVLRPCAAAVARATP